MGFIIHVKVKYEHNGARYRGAKEVSCTGFHNIWGSKILINCSL